MPTLALCWPINVAAQWVQSHGVRLVLAEFGVVCKALEQRSIGWTAWE